MRFDFISLTRIIILDTSQQIHVVCKVHECYSTPNWCSYLAIHIEQGIYSSVYEVVSQAAQQVILVRVSPLHTPLQPLVKYLIWMNRTCWSRMRSPICCNSCLGSGCKITFHRDFPGLKLLKIPLVECKDHTTTIYNWCISCWMGLVL